MVKFDNDWDTILEGEFDKPYYRELRSFLASEYRLVPVYPPMHDIFSALKLTSYANTKAVILGQDPYHGAGQANGLAFSVNNNVPKPPSLENIFKELSTDIGASENSSGDLSRWAKQGVLLLNTVLTVRGGAANSHRGKGWEIFTDRVIDILNQKQEPVVFLLWGANAKAKAQLITNRQHCILTAAHPSPLSAHNGFFGCRHFSKTNAFLREHRLEEINWG